MDAEELIDRLNIDTAPLIDDAGYSSKAVGSVLIGGKSYAVNLLWDIANNGREARKTVLDKAQQIDSNYACCYRRAKDLVQYGLADSSLGHKKDMLVLAAMMAKETKISRLGAWLTDDQCWVVIGIREDGVILVDKAFKNRDGAEYEIWESLQLAEWSEICCPDTWGIPSVTSRGIDISELLSKKAYRIDELRKSRARLVMYLVVSMVLAGIAYYSFNFIQDFLRKREEQKQLEQEKRRREELANRAKQLALSRYILPPWVNQQKPVVTLEKCILEIGQIYLMSYGIPGWQPNNTIVCNGKNISVNLTKTFGTELWLSEMVTHLSLKPNLVYNDKSNVTLVWQIDSHQNDVYLEKERYKDKNIQYRSLDDIQLYLNNVFSETFIKIGFSDIYLNEDTEQGSEWAARGFNFRLASYLPTLFAAPFSQIEGLVIESVEYQCGNVGECSWFVKGIFYAKN